MTGRQSERADGALEEGRRFRQPKEGAWNEGINLLGFPQLSARCVSSTRSECLESVSCELSRMQLKGAKLRCGWLLPGVRYSVSVR